MERSSPSRVAGTVIRKCTLAGTEYTLSQPDKVRKAADEESVIISRRLDMLEAVALSCAKLPPERGNAVLGMFVEKLVCGIASTTEWASYYNSWWRRAFRFWNALDPKHKEGKTLLEGVEWAYELISSDDVTEDERAKMERAIVQVSQEDEIKNCFGSQEPGATQATAIQDTGDTTTSSPSSPKKD